MLVVKKSNDYVQIIGEAAQLFGSIFRLSNQRIVPAIVGAMRDVFHLKHKLTKQEVEIPKLFK